MRSIYHTVSIRAATILREEKRRKNKLIVNSACNNNKSKPTRKWVQYKKEINELPAVPVFFCSSGTWPTQPTDRTTALPYKTNGAHELYGTVLMVIVYGQFKGLRHSGANAVPSGVWNHFREWYGRVVSVFRQITIQLFREWWIPLFTNTCQRGCSVDLGKLDLRSFSFKSIECLNTPQKKNLTYPSYNTFSWSRTSCCIFTDK